MNIKTLGSIGLLAVLSLVPAFGQLATLTGTTLSVAAAITDDTVTLASATGVTLQALGVAPSTLFVVSPGAKGEAMSVKSLVSGTTYRVSRGIQGTARTAQTSGALVLLGAPNNFKTIDPTGGCVTATTSVTPFVNISNGLQWLCSTVTLTWVPGFGNTSRPAQATTAVASAAGAVVPSGPLFHMTGTAAVTGFTLPLGIVNGDSFCVLSDGVWTWTAAGNIAILGTSTAAGRQQCFVWDAAAVKWYPASVV
jgi:hypothetical protein